MATQAVRTFTEQGHQVILNDLYRQSYNPVSARHNFTSVKDPAFLKQQAEETYATEVDGFASGVEEEIRKVEQSDLMIWQFPLWWFSVPAILKGWVDRTFAMGRTYGNGRFYEKGMFKGKKALLSLTTGGGPADYAPGGFNGDLMGILRPLHRGILQFTGFSVLAPHIVYSPARRPKEELEKELKTFADRLIHIWEEPEFEVGAY